jgi:hypothetical protein
MAAPLSAPGRRGGLGAKTSSRRKPDLTRIKAAWRIFQPISADTKDLDDIPHDGLSLGSRASRRFDAGVGLFL